MALVWKFRKDNVDRRAAHSRDDITASLQQIQGGAETADFTSRRVCNKPENVGINGTQIGCIDAYRNWRFGTPHASSSVDAVAREMNILSGERRLDFLRRHNPQQVFTTTQCFARHLLNLIGRIRELADNDRLNRRLKWHRHTPLHLPYKDVYLMCVITARPIDHRMGQVYIIREISRALWSSRKT